MALSSFHDTAADDLLERIKNLKELLRSDAATAGDVSPEIPGPAPNERESTPSQSQQRQRHFSPPTRDSISRNQHRSESPASSTNKELIDETWHLLTQVSFVRIVIDRLTWIEAPKFILDELKKPHAPRKKSLIILEYCFPSITSSDGSISARDLGKRIVVPAKDVLNKVVHFNHRNVVPVRITEPIVQLWSQSYFTIKIFFGKKPNTPIGKCNIPLCKLVVLPFSFDADVPVEVAFENMKCQGKLKLCIQLGSRYQSFTERVEPMRNPTTSVTEFTFMDPMKLTPRVPDTTTKPIPPTRSQAAYVNKEAENRPILDRVMSPAPSASASPSFVSPLRPREPLGTPTDTGRQLNETFTPKFSSFSPTSHFWHDQNSRQWRDDIMDRPIFLRHPLVRRGDGLDTARSTAEPYVSNISVYGDRSTAPSSSGLNRFGSTEFCRQNAASAQIEKNASAVNEKSDAAAQTSTIIDEKESPPNQPTKASSRTRRPTVAEKILKNGSLLDVEERPKSIPPATGSISGIWLNLIIHRARNLPLIKEPKSGQKMVKPTSFWTYASDSSVCFSPIVIEDCEPTWNWSSRLFVAPDRKTLVLKLWHRGKEGPDRVLGFVAILFPIMQPFQRVWYDIIDLARSSTGQVELSFAIVNGGRNDQLQPATNPFQAENDIREMAMEFTPPSSVGAAEAETDFQDTGVNTTARFPSSTKRSSSSSPFIALTTRSFLTHKLRTNMEELSTLTTHLKQSHAATMDPSSGRERSSRSCPADDGQNIGTTASGSGFPPQAPSSRQESAGIGNDRM